MTNEQIKMMADLHCTVINNATKALEHLREVCPHEHTHIGKYSWRIGVIQDARMCDYCGKMIAIIDCPL